MTNCYRLISGWFWEGGGELNSDQLLQTDQWLVLGGGGGELNSDQLLQTDQWLVLGGGGGVEQ